MAKKKKKKKVSRKPGTASAKITYRGHKVEIRTSGSQNDLVVNGSVVGELCRDADTGEYIAPSQPYTRYGSPEEAMQGEVDGTLDN